MDTSTESITTLVKHLRFLAQGAPASPWKVATSSGYANPSVRTAAGPLFSTGNARKLSDVERFRAATYVAAVEPANLAAILDLLEQITAERDRLIEANDTFVTEVEKLQASVRRLNAIFAQGV